MNLTDSGQHLYIARAQSIPSLRQVPQSKRQDNAPEFIGSNTIANIFVATRAAIANINTITNIRQATYKRKNLSPQESFPNVKKRFGINLLPSDDSTFLEIKGSGVVVRSDGYILTSLHVIQNAARINVTLSDGSVFVASVYGRDDFSDLAMLKIEAENLLTVQFGNSEELKVGDWVIAIGNPFGLENTLTHGLVSGLEREARGYKSFGAKSGAIRYIQTDAPINPGSSGGPLINLKGKVVGINTFIRDDAQNIAFAIPSNTAREIAKKLIAHKIIAHPYIGIEMKEQNISDTSNYTRLGVEITNVKPFGPASKAKIEPGDVIIAIDQLKVLNSDDVARAVSRCSIGQEIAVKISRQGKERVFLVKVGELPSEE